jgi:hypothetical protein
LPEATGHYVLAAICHIEKLLKQRPRTPEQLEHRMRPEFRGDVLDAAIAHMSAMGKLGYTPSGQLKLATTPRALRRLPRDDGGEGLFLMPERVPK